MGIPLVIPTEKQDLVLRQLTSQEDDEAYFEAQHEDPEHITRFDNTLYESIEEVRIARLSAGKRLWMGIWLGDKLIGKIDAKPNENGTEAELGYWLRPSATGKGYATAAVKAFTNYLQPEFSRIFAEVHEDNQASIKVMERSGYKKIGTIKRNWGQAIVFEPKDFLI